MTPIAKGVISTGVFVSAATGGYGIHHHLSREEGATKTEESRDVSGSQGSDPTVTNTPKAQTGIQSSQLSNPTFVAIKAATDGKFGFDFQMHFSDASGEENKAWWDGVYNSRYKGTQDSENKALSDDFKNGITDANGLKAKCQEAYGKETKTEIHPETGDSKTNYEKDIWIFCSKEGKKPLTIAESSSEETDYQDFDGSSNKLGSTKKSSLISTKNSKNDWFWRVQETAFLKTTTNGTETAGLGAKATASNSPFKTLYENANRTNDDTLKKTCEKQYNETSKNDSETQKETLIFCSL